MSGRLMKVAKKYFLEKKAVLLYYDVAYVGFRPDHQVYINRIIYKSCSIAMETSTIPPQLHLYQTGVMVKNTLCNCDMFLPHMALGSIWIVL